jgi:F420-0:gamma-glutamyl ligase-like protein
MGKMKDPVISVGAARYLRIPVKTHVLTEDDDVVEVVRRYAVPQAQEGDVLFFAETGLAIIQGRARHISGIHVSSLARFLSRLVTKSKYGVGLRSPYAMQVAIEEVGVLRILMGTAASAFGKIVLRRTGDFYIVAGRSTKMIDAEHTMAIERYFECVVPGPLRIRETCAAIKEATGLDACVVDVNDIQYPWVIDASFERARFDEVAAALTDNPLGQGSECTPMGLIRRLSSRDAQLTPALLVERTAQRV